MRRFVCLAAIVLSLGFVNSGVLAQDRPADGRDKGAAIEVEKPLADREKAVAERVFANADKNKDGALEGKELLEAKRIFRTAILQGKKANEIPGGKLTMEKIGEAASKGKLDAATKVNKDEWLDHAKDAFAKRDGIVKEIIEKANAEFRERAEKAKKDRG
jgi:hypothetical protein